MGILWREAVVVVEGELKDQPVAVSRTTNPHCPSTLPSPSLHTQIPPFPSTTPPHPFHYFPKHLYILTNAISLLPQAPYPDSIRTFSDAPFPPCPDPFSPHY